jgi:hypothetical protein
VSDADLTHTIHAVVARLAERVLDRDENSPLHGFRVAPQVARDSTDPDLRRTFALSANAGWIALSFLFTVGILVLAFPARAVLGSGAGDAVAVACLSGAMFCAAGAVNVLWRMYWYVPQARRRARKYGVDSKRFTKSMRRTMPRNTSLLFQTAVAVLTVVIAV